MFPRGRKRRSDHASFTSDLAGLADILADSRHVSKGANRRHCRCGVRVYLITHVHKVIEVEE
jgi:hypothetical protein